MIEIKPINKNNTFICLTESQGINTLSLKDLKKEVNKALNVTNKRLIFNMSGIVEVNEKGIRNLMAIRDVSNKKGISFTLYNIEPQVVEKLEVLKLRESFDLYGEQYIGEFIPAC